MRTRICLAVLALLAAGCSESEDTNTPEVQVNAKAIRIGQSVQGMTRAAVENGSAVSATVLMCDGETADWSNFTAVSSNGINSSTSALESRATTSTATFTAGTKKAVTLTPTLYYNTDGSTKSHLAAVAPAGALGASSTTVTMSTVDGQQDVMYAAAVSAGTGTTATTNIELSFNHLTTQLNFKVKMTEASGTGEWDNKTVTVKSIKVQSAQLPQSVNAADGTVAWSNASLLEVPTNNTVLSTTAAEVGNPIMIKGGSTVKLDVTLTVSGKGDLQFSNVPIKDSGASDLATVTGSSHLITLNVTEPQAASGSGVAIIDVTATVAQWIVGTPGTGELN